MRWISMSLSPYFHNMSYLFDHFPLQNDWWLVHFFTQLVWSSISPNKYVISSLCHHSTTYFSWWTSRPLSFCRQVPEPWRSLHARCPGEGRGLSCPVGWLPWDSTTLHMGMIITHLYPQPGSNIRFKGRIIHYNPLYMRIPLINWPGSMKGTRVLNTARLVI